MCFPRQFISQFILTHPPIKKYAGESMRHFSCKMTGLDESSFEPQYFHLLLLMLKTLSIQ